MAWAPKCKQEADGMGPRRFEWLGHRNADKRLMAVAPGSSHTSSGKARTPAPLASRQVRARLSSGHIPFQLLGGRWFQQYPFQRISDLAALDGGVWHPQSNGGMLLRPGRRSTKTHASAVSNCEGHGGANTRETNNSLATPAGQDELLLAACSHVHFCAAKPGGVQAIEDPLG